MIFKTKQKTDNYQDEYIVALDIGTEFVKALIARLEGNDIKIVGVGRAQQELSDMHSGAIADIAGVVRNCETALAALKSKRAYRRSAVWLVSLASW